MMCRVVMLAIRQDNFPETYAGGSRAGILFRSFWRCQEELVYVYVHVCIGAPDNWFTFTFFLRLPGTRKDHNAINEIEKMQMIIENAINIRLVPLINRQIALINRKCNQ